MPHRSDTPVLLHRRFDDFEELTVAARLWDIDLLQLDTGCFQGETLQAAAGRVLLSEGRFGRVLKQQGTAPKAMRTFVIPATREVRFKWRGLDVEPDDLLVFPQDGELHCISQPDFHVFTVSLPESLLYETAKMADATRFLEMLLHERMRCPSPLMACLREYLRGVIQTMKEDAQLLNNSAVVRDWQCEIPLRLVKAMTAADTSTKILPVGKRQRAIKRAEQYIMQFQNRPLTVSDVCQAANVSERTLQYAFIEQIGVTPRAYLKAVRLNGVRRDLKHAHPHAVRINEIASHWGFWHMGQFAADYRRHFCELPSQTLSTADERTDSG
jgi:AraC family transcriptional regulator, ethanolamine operon transcriptional activator